jgi:4-coumarate--CoA ligase
MPNLSAAACQRVLRALLVKELGTSSARRIRPADAAAWPDSLNLDADGLGLDSLELLACGGAVNAFFRLHETGLEDYLLAERRLDSWVRIIQAALTEGTSGYSFNTSGSTGTARPCTHTHATLAAEVDHWAALFGDRQRVIQLVPAQHIYGFLFNVLLPEQLNLPVLDARTIAPGRLRKMLRPDDLLVGFPAGWPSLLRSVEALPVGIQATSSTAPLPAAMHHALRAAGVAQVTEIYGSSETAGLASRTAPDAPFALLPRWRPGQSGDEASVTESETRASIPLPDRAAWTKEGHLRLLGRKDAAVQVGGINVYPEQIAHRLAAHPLVAEAAVRLDTSLPEPRLKAFCTLTGGRPAVARGALERWCLDHLTAAERPVHIAIGRKMPRNALGKASDWAPTAMTSST